MKSLQLAQQSFVVTDPSLSDNPIVFASQGFLDLTGYRKEEVLGRNCRFLQGSHTDPKQITKVRDAVEQAQDISLSLLNYRADGSTFFNQLFVAALRGENNNVVNYVGVQCAVPAPAPAPALPPTPPLDSQSASASSPAAAATAAAAAAVGLAGVGGGQGRSSGSGESRSQVGGGGGGSDTSSPSVVAPAAATGAATSVPATASPLGSPAVVADCTLSGNK
ncbi:unnamed protein product [Discosporangium mesarthrocarpum]